MEIDRGASWGTAIVGGALTGLALTAAGAIVSRGGASAPLWLRGLRNAGALAGVAAVVNALGNGEPGQRAFNSTWQQRNQLWFAARHPIVATDARASYFDARDMQQEHWGEVRHIDDGIDAVRHAYGSGVLAARLIDRGMSAEAALAMTRAVGDAHERDGLDNGAESARMDRFNNDVGARIAAELGSDGDLPTHDELFEAVMDAARRGELQLLDAGELRATTSADVREARS